ncbi:MAG: mechanosensitive ion channel family protein [Kiritimatiellae bacterium]|nr:mechanosensitive ion channel family protein [Kiritimatiellia bacterium]
MNTNTVVEATTNAAAAAACAVQTAGAKLADTVGKQAAEGQAFLKQALAWLTEHGLDFAVNVLAAVLILLVGGLVVKGIVAAVRKALMKSRRVDELLRTFICSVVSKTGWAILFIVALGRLGVDVGPLVASLGVTGVVLGFAFKESLGSLASGLMIALNHPFKVGDYVITGGVEGAVTELNMMATVLATADNKKVTVPNAAVWGSAITNFSALGKRRVDTVVAVAYGTDLTKAVDVARTALQKVPGVLADPAPAVAVGSLGDSAVIINVRPWAACADYWAVFSGAQQAVKEAFEREGITIPFPQVNVHMANS